MATIERLTREEVIESYTKVQQQTGQEFSVKTIPYYSTAILEFEVVNQDTTHSFGYAIARAQSFDWFSYGVGNRIVYGDDDSHKATRADTNLSKPNSTNGAFDFVIEGIGVHAKSPRIRYGTRAAFVLSEQTADADVTKALNGTGDIFDPTAIAAVQQCASPFFSASVFWEAIKNYASVGITFDSTNYRELGTLSNFAQGREAHPEYNGATPPEDLALQIREGLLWAKDGEPDSDLTLRGTLHKPVVVPISGITAPGDGSTIYVPERIYLPLVATLHGLEIGLPSSNT